MTRRTRPAHRRPTATIAATCCAALLAAGCATVEDTFVTELEKQGLVAEKTERGVVLYLPDVLFDFDRDDLTDPAREKLRSVAELIVELAPERTVSVEGHSDSIGSEDYNQALSVRRAESVQRALVGSGVDAAQVTVVGHGEHFPIAPNTRADGRDDPEGRARNRRVEVVIERTP